MGLLNRLFGALRKTDSDGIFNDEADFEEDEYYSELYHNAKWGKSDPPDDEDWDEWYRDIFSDDEDEE